MRQIILSFNHMPNQTPLSSSLLAPQAGSRVRWNPGAGRSWAAESVGVEQAFETVR
jgi:hypothetical protein